MWNFYISNCEFIKFLVQLWLGFLSSLHSSGSRASDLKGIIKPRGRRMAPFAEGTGPSEPGVGGQGGKGAIDPLPQIFGRNRSKAFFPQKALFYRLSPWIFKPSYSPEEEEERKEALTLAHIRVHIFVSNLRISLTEHWMSMLFYQL